MDVNTHSRKERIKRNHKSVCIKAFHLSKWPENPLYLSLSLKLNLAFLLKRKDSNGNDGTFSLLTDPLPYPSRLLLSSSIFTLPNDPDFQMVLLFYYELLFLSFVYWMGCVHLSSLLSSYIIPLLLMVSLSLITSFCTEWKSWKKNCPPWDFVFICLRCIWLHLSLSLLPTAEVKIIVGSSLYISLRFSRFYNFRVKCSWHLFILKPYKWRLWQTSRQLDYHIYLVI
jgi:hypothetical protein